MGDAAPGDHPVQRAGRDDLVGAGAVAVMEVALEQVGDRAEADMRMRPHVDALAGQQLGRPGLVEEDERPDHLPLRRRQGAPDLEAAKVARARDDEGLDRIDADLVGTARFDRWVPAHARHPLSLGTRWRRHLLRSPDRCAVTHSRQKIAEFSRTVSKNPNELKSPRSDETEMEQERHRLGKFCTAALKSVR